MGAAISSFQGNDVLDTLLGSTLAEGLLAPSAQTSGALVSSTSSLSAQQAADSVLFSPAAQKLLHMLADTTLASETTQGQRVFGSIISSVGAPTGTEQPPDGSFIAASAYGGNAGTDGPQGITGVGISSRIWRGLGLGPETNASNSLDIRRDADGELHIHLSLTDGSSPDGKQDDTAAVTDDVTISQNGQVTFRQQASLSEYDRGFNGVVSLSDVGTDLNLQDTANGTVRTVSVEGDSETVDNGNIVSFNETKVQVRGLLQEPPKTVGEDGIALQLLQAAKPAATHWVQAPADAATQITQNINLAASAWATIV